MLVVRRQVRGAFSVCDAEELREIKTGTLLTGLRW